MNPTRLPNGNLQVPARAEGPGGIIGDGLIEIGPTHPDYATWDEYLSRIEASSPEK